METVADFVQRTKGPVLPFVADWYPWVYAHHYLRLEAAQLPAEVSGAPDASMSLAQAQELIHLWCALSGESVVRAAQTLADAYLSRWGIARDGEAPAPALAAPIAPSRRDRRRRAASRIPTQPGRVRRGLSVVTAAARSA